jgi:TolA-binding protein
MKRTFSILIGIVLLSSCGNQSEEKTEQPAEAKKADHKEELHNTILRMEGEMHRSQELDNVLAGQAIKAYDDYAEAYPEDTIAPDYLFKAGEIATAIRQYPQAASYYETIINRYPKFRLIQESYFMEATVYDQYLNDDDKAKTIYENLLNTFPGGPYTADTKAAIANLGKSDEELIKEFEKKNKMN